MSRGERDGPDESVYEHNERRDGQQPAIRVPSRAASGLVNCFSCAGWFGCLGIQEAQSVASESSFL